jgi:hypothetical protein
MNIFDSAHTEKYKMRVFLHAECGSSSTLFCIVLRRSVVYGILPGYYCLSGILFLTDDKYSNDYRYGSRATCRLESDYGEWMCFQPTEIQRDCRNIVQVSALEVQDSVELEARWTTPGRRDSVQESGRKRQEDYRHVNERGDSLSGQGGVGELPRMPVRNTFLRRPCQHLSPQKRKM